MVGAGRSGVSDLSAGRPRGDLDDPEQIAEMVRRFYSDVAVDDLLGPVFNDVARVDWDEHLPKLTQFWSRALLGIEGYTGNPFRSHAQVDERSPLKVHHFDRWLYLFRRTINSGWSGPNVQRALELVDNVARVHCKQIVGVELDA